MTHSGGLQAMGFRLSALGWRGRAMLPERRGSVMKQGCCFDQVAPWFAAMMFLVVSALSRVASAQQGDLDPRITKLVAAVSEDRLATILKKLESFETRSTFSATNSPSRGIGAARQWIFEEMKSYGSKLAVSFESFRVAGTDGVAPAGPRIARDVDIRNIIAVLPGKSPRRIYISGQIGRASCRERVYVLV